MPPSSTSTPRQNQLVALRRQLILEAAQRVFARDGLDQASMRAIAKEAGCTTGAIYPWFAGKEALYAALLEASLEELRTRLEQALHAGAAGSAARRVVRAFFDYYAVRPDAFSLGMYLYRGVGPRGLGRETDERLNALLQTCVDQLGAGLRLGRGMHDAAARSEQVQVFTYLMGLLLLFHTHRLKSLGQQPEPLLDAYCDALEQRP
ncbi:TetR/AcrR family transcriptional regulator [Bordetella sp. 2513F-2]